MSNILKTKKLYNRRKSRTRYKIAKVNQTNRIRLSIFRSGKHIYGQFINDLESLTIASASSLNQDLKNKLKNGGNILAAKEVGYMLAAEAKKNNIEKDDIVFDRGGYLFHGRVKALVEAVLEKLN